MMPVYRIMCGTFLLHFFLCLHSVPMPNRSGNRYKSATEWLEKSHDNHLKKKGGLPHTLDTLKESRVRGHLHGRLPPRSGSASGQRPRCGVPDSPVHGGQRRQKRFVLTGKKWQKNDLTYKIVNFPSHLSQEKVRWVMKEAQEMWSKVSQLTLTEVNDGHSDITVDFLSFCRSVIILGGYWFTYRQEHVATSHSLKHDIIQQKYLQAFRFSIVKLSVA